MIEGIVYVVVGLVLALIVGKVIPAPPPRELWEQRWMRWVPPAMIVAGGVFIGAAILDPAANHVEAPPAIEITKVAAGSRVMVPSFGFWIVLGPTWTTESSTLGIANRLSAVVSSSGRRVILLAAWGDDTDSRKGIVTMMQGMRADDATISEVAYEDGKLGGHEVSIATFASTRPDSVVHSVLVAASVFYRKQLAIRCDAPTEQACRTLLASTTWF